MPTTRLLPPSVFSDLPAALVRVRDSHQLGLHGGEFLPFQKLVHLSGYFKHHIGGGQLPKNRYEIL